jgi:hypothetical protein
METNLMNNIRNLRASEGDVLKSTVKVAIVRGIKNMQSGYCRKFGLVINRCRSRIANACQHEKEHQEYVVAAIGGERILYM